MTGLPSASSATPLTPALRASLLLHPLAIAAWALAPGKWPWWAGTLLLDHVTLYGAGMWPRSRLLGPNLSRLPEGSGGVALTFDDGPEPGVTERVLDLLGQAGAPAAFFCIGRRALEHGDLVREIARRGHTVGNHSFAHSYAFALLDPWSLRRDLARAQRVLTELAGQPPVFFRPPAGIRSPYTEPILRRLGLRLVSWSRRGFDALRSDPRAIASRLLAGLDPGAILLLHDGRLHRRGRQPAVLDVLPRVLDELGRRGLRALPLRFDPGPEG